jgi:hypothetical protein
VEVIGATEGEPYGMRPLQVAQDVDGSGPVVQCVAVHKGRKATHSESNIRVGGDSNIIEGTNKSVIGSAGLPLNDLGWNGNSFVRALQNKACNHRGITRVSI